MYNEFVKKSLIITTIISMLFVNISVPSFASNTEYDFSDEAQAEFDKIWNQSLPYPNEPPLKSNQNEYPSTQTNTPPTQIHEQNQQQTLQGSLVYIPEGENFQAVLQSAISSVSLANNDTISAVIENDWIYNGVLITPKGSILYGKALNVKKAGSGYGNGKISITFNEILTPKGDTLTLTSNIVTVQVENKRAVKIAGNVIAGAIIGAGLGLLHAWVYDSKASTGAIVGASIGGAGGTIKAISQKGEDVEIPAGTSLLIRLTKPMNVTPYK